MPESEATLEYQGRSLVLDPPFTIGRSKSCALSVDDPQASREHVMIVREQRSGQWLLSDLSSTNGTYLNGRRVVGTERLKANDSFSIGKLVFTFRLAGEPAFEPATTLAARTIISIEKHRYWLVLADVRDSTRLAQKLPHAEASLKIRQWIDECRPLLEPARCAINEYLGDGFLAVCRERQTTPEAIVCLLHQLGALRSETGLNFRVVAHCGELQTGAGVSSGVEKLSGPELNFLFKSEKAVSKLGRRINVSEAAFEKLGRPVKFEKVGEVRLDGFEGSHTFYALPETVPGGAGWQSVA